MRTETAMRVLVADDNTDAAYAVLLTYVYWIGISAAALRRLREPSVDILRLTIRFWQGIPARG